MKVAAIVPTRDEESTIVPLLKNLLNFADSVIVVDYRSSDATVELAQRCGVLVDQIDYAGVGYAYEYAWDRLPDDWWVGHIDAGGSHDPQDLCDMVDLAARHDYDLVVGSRFCFGGEDHAPWHRRFLSKTAARICNRKGHDGFTDWTSGLRVYSPRARAVLAAHRFSTGGHAWQIEALWVAQTAGLTSVEFPITYEPSSTSLSTTQLTEAAVLLWKLTGTP